MFSLVQASFRLIGDVNSTSNGIEEDSTMVSNCPLWTIESHDVDGLPLVHPYSLEGLREAYYLLIAFWETPFLDSSIALNLPHRPISVLLHCWGEKLGWGDWSVCCTTCIMDPDWQFSIYIRSPVQVSTISSVDYRLIPLFRHLHDPHLVLTLGIHVMFNNTNKCRINEIKAMTWWFRALN